MLTSGSVTITEILKSFPQKRTWRRRTKIVKWFVTYSCTFKLLGYSRINRDQLDITCFIISLFNAQHVSDVNTSILRSLRLIYPYGYHTTTAKPQRNTIHPSSEACDLFVELFHGLYCSGSMCVGVTLWFGWGGVITPTHIEQEQYNPWNNSTNKSQAPEDACINIRNMLSIK